ncbi:MAG: FG-GAP-like repeat-containing protein [bacterium]|nr:FG-GAP-like repeat-containing protein [bacterium]
MIRGVVYIAIFCLITSTGFGQTFTDASVTNLPDLTDSEGHWFEVNNDGGLDFIIAGTEELGADYFRIFTNNGDGTFGNTTGGITTLTDMRFALADFNHDGFIDILVQGEDASGDPVTTYYENNGNSTFSAIDKSLENLEDGDLATGDLDNDGDIDIVLTGRDNSGSRQTIVYQNQSGVFTEVSNSFSDVANGEIKIFDADNDGILDVLITGVNSALTRVANLYINDGEWSFTLSGSSFTTTSFNDIEIADFDLNGFLDIVITGLSFGGESSEIYYNTNGTFSNTDIGLEDLTSGVVAAADLNADGYPDILISGQDGGGTLSLTYLRSDGAGGFDIYTDPIEEISNGFIQLADFDGDNNVDILNSGSTETSLTSGVFENDTTATITMLSSPTSLSSTVNEDTVNLTWNSVTNATSYNLYVKNGTEDTIIVMPTADTVSGFVRLANYGNATIGDIALSGLPEGNYTWAVQSLNGSNQGSSFSATEEFEICYSVTIGSDTAICYNESILLEAGEGTDDVNWYSTTDGSLASSTFQFDYTVLKKDTIVAEVNKAFGCTVYDSIIIDVIDLPDFSLGSDTSVCFNESIELSVIGFDSVNWFSTNNGSTALSEDEESYIHTVTEKDTLIAEVFNSSGCVNYDSIIIDVIDLPSFSLGSDTSICDGETLELSVSSLGIIDLDSVNWYSMNSGSTPVSLDQESYTHLVSEKDTIVAEVYNTSGCVNYDSIIIDVIDLPTFSLGSDTSVCFEESISFSVSSLGIVDLDSVNWYTVKSGDEPTLRDSEDYDHLVTETDTVIAEVFNSSGCLYYDSIIVTVIDLPTFSLGSDTSICYNSEIQLSVSDLGITNLDSVNWYSVVNDIAVSSNSEDYDHLVTEKDTIVAEVYNTSGCIGYDSIIIDVIDLPSYSLGSDTSICLNESITFSVTDLGITDLDSVNWYTTIEGLVLKNSESYEHVVTELDTVVAEVYNTSGCIGYDSIIVDVNDLPSFDLGEDLSICFEETVEISVSDLGIADLDSVNWYTTSNGDDAILMDNEIYEYVVQEKDTIIAEVYNTNGCVGYDTIIVDVLALPEFSLGNDTSICYSSEISFDLSSLNIENLDSANWYLTSNGSSAVLENSLTYNFQALEEDTIVAEVFNTNGCVNYDSIIISILDLPEFSLGNDTSVCLQEDILLSLNLTDISEIDSTNWYSVTNGYLTSTKSEYTHTVVATDTIVAEAVNNTGCSFRDTIIIEQIALPSFSLGSDTAICFGSSILLEVTEAGDLGIDQVDWNAFVESGLPSDTNRYQHEVNFLDTLTAKVTNEMGCINYDTIIISSIDLPTFDLGADTSLCSGSSILLQTSTEFIETNWYGGSGDELQENSFFYNYAVGLDASSEVIAEFTSVDGCVNYDSITIIENMRPEVDLGEDQSLCFGDTLRLNQTGLVVDWGTVDSGELIQDSNDFEEVFAESQDVWAEVEDGNGCTNSDTVAITINLLPEINIPTDTSVCRGESISFETSEFATIQWSSEEGTSGSETVFEYLVNQDDEIVLSVTDGNNCFNSDTTIVTLEELPQFEIGDNQEICDGDSITVTSTSETYSMAWFSEAQGMLDSAVYSTSYLPNAEDIVTAIGYTEFGCTDTREINIAINELPGADAGNDTLVCKQAPVILNTDVGTNNTYEWLPTTYQEEIDGNLVASPTETISYQLKVTDPNGCESIDSLTVTINADNLLDAGEDIAICIGDEIRIGGTPTATGSSFGYEYEWIPATNLDNSNSSNPVASPEETTTYRVLVSTGECAVDTAEVTITVHELPVIEIIQDTTIGAGEEITLFASGGEFYEWFPNTALDNDEISNPTASPVSEIVYEVLVTDENGCEDVAEVRIKVNNAFFIPNLFTPNNDGLNDRFTLFGDGVRDMVFRVFDSSGAIVYQANSWQEAEQEGWDGTIGGSPAPNGTYIWSIKGSYFNGSEVKFDGKTKGVIRLLR